MDSKLFSVFVAQSLYNTVGINSPCLPEKADNIFGKRPQFTLTWLPPLLGRRTAYDNPMRMKENWFSYVYMERERNNIGDSPVGISWLSGKYWPRLILLSRSMYTGFTVVTKRSTKLIVNPLRWIWHELVSWRRLLKIDSVLNIL